jgi:recombination protein RecT
MATVNGLKNQLANKSGQAPKVGNSVKGLLSSDSVKKRFEDVLKDRAPQFMASLLSVVNNNDLLRKAEPMSIIQSAMIAASLDLPIDPNLGCAYIVPYKNQGTFQIGYRGYIQMALRTGQYKNINVIEIYEGEFVKFNRLTEELELDFEARKSDAIVGYAAYFELLNGFKKTIYWTKEQVDHHKNKFSKSSFVWKENYSAMAQKTVLKSLLSKWGILSIELQKAVIEDDEERVVKDVTESEDTNIIDYEEAADETKDEIIIE